MNQTFPYPPSPEGVDFSITHPSHSYRQQVFKVMLAILLFIASYLILLAAALALAVTCVYLGFMLITLKFSFYTLIGGLGIMGVGAMVVFFVLKFIAASSKTDTSHMKEVTEEEQPALFDFIRKITEETKAPFPKHVYLSNEVNAYVFYDSTFWSLFFPVRKNLTIGLGLVNALNLSEFKAVVAHEFGHFSQRSMRLGSYVYNVNRIIFNMLYENDSYSALLTKWSSISGYFALFARITAAIVNGIRWILQILYGTINKVYKVLSREMEFHADTVSALSAGSNHLGPALRKAEISNVCIMQLLQLYGKYQVENLRGEKIFRDHALVLQEYAKEHQLQFDNGLITLDDNARSENNRRVSYKDQWASHPPSEERAEKLQQLNIPTKVVNESAWKLIAKRETLEALFTANFYLDHKFANKPEVLDEDAFRKCLQREVDAVTFNPVWKNYYNNRLIKFQDMKTSEALETASLEKLMDPELLKLPATLESLEADLVVLDAIASKQLAVRTFEFDGKKVKVSEAAELARTLRAEKQDIENRLAKNDHRLYNYFISIEKQRGGNALHTSVDEFGELHNKQLKVQAIVEGMYKELEPLFGSGLQLPQLRLLLKKLGTKEPALKNVINELLADERFKIDVTEKEALNKYLSRDWVYLDGEHFHDHALQVLLGALSALQISWNKKLFSKARQILDIQATLM